MGMGVDLMLVAGCSEHPVGVFTLFTFLWCLDFGCQWLGWDNVLS